ncbi:MAG: hypothetical protein KC877_01255 [Candidatus Kaiserbacteria bacterium]|nr:hypothetical protein [Candidatus Kaiserbacteria bacterium]MCB9816532.1 hypothetical protein [Candidatus Nomurabacteria bacterium]
MKPSPNMMDVRTALLYIFALSHAVRNHTRMKPGLPLATAELLGSVATLILLALLAMLQLLPSPLLSTVEWVMGLPLLATNLISAALLFISGMSRVTRELWRMT